jgi:hypothetical protein
MQKKYFIFNISYNLPKGTFIFSLKKFNFFYNFVLKFNLKSINYFRTNYSTSPSSQPRALLLLGRGEGCKEPLEPHPCSILAKSHVRYFPITTSRFQFITT